MDGEYMISGRPPLSPYRATIDNAAGNPVPTTQGTNSTLVSGRKTSTTPGTAVQITAASTPCKIVKVTGLPANAGNVAVGGTATLATAGSEAGLVITAFGFMVIEIDNLNKLYLDVATSGDGISYIYEN